jgi:hypothetical protein
VRVARAVVVGLWVAVGAVAAHATQGGGAPSVVALAPVAVAVAAVVGWLGTRRLHFATAFGLLALAQVAVHALSSYVHGHGMAPTAPMVVAHLVAIAAVAAGLASADKLWWSWWERVTLIVRVHDHLVPPVAAAPVPVGIGLPGPRTTLAHGVRRRGPPAV